jgi:Cu/Ag efflux protein CusF
LSVLLGAALVALPAAADDEKKPKRDQSTAAQGGYGQADKDQARAHKATDKDATIGTVKEFRTGDEITINVPNWPDKSYDLKSTDQHVTVAAGLRVGDRVKVVETDHDGKKLVHITKYSGAMPDTRASDRTTPMTDAYGGAAAGARGRGTDDATYGTVKELRAGNEITINVDNMPDKSFDLNSQDERVVVASGLKVGDHVKVVEREQNGKKTVHITKHSGKMDAPRTDEPGAAPRNR